MANNFILKILSLIQILEYSLRSNGTTKIELYSYHTENQLQELTNK